MGRCRALRPGISYLGRRERIVGLLGRLGALWSRKSTEYSSIFEELWGFPFHLSGGRRLNACSCFYGMAIRFTKQVRPLPSEAVLGAGSGGSFPVMMYSLRASMTLRMGSCPRCFRVRKMLMRTAWQFAPNWLRLPSVAPGSASGTAGSTFLRQLGHQSR